MQPNPNICDETKYLFKVGLELLYLTLNKKVNGGKDETGNS